MSKRGLYLLLTFICFSLIIWNVSEELNRQFMGVSLPETYSNVAEQHNVDSAERVIFIDYTRNRNKVRLWIVEGDSVLLASTVSHGRNSGVAKATQFSNKVGSNKTSLGVYRTAEEYVGKHGRSLRVDGLDSTNSNARQRAIVFHGSDYVNDFRAGRSLGCFATSHQVNDQILDLVSQVGNVRVIVIG